MFRKIPTAFSLNIDLECRENFPDFAWDERYIRG
jgi:hypothetical protein